LNPSGAGGAILPLVAHISSHDQAQNHISGWSYALTHLDSKQPSWFNLISDETSFKVTKCLKQKEMERTGQID